MALVDIFDESLLYIKKPLLRLSLQSHLTDHAVWLLSVICIFSKQLNFTRFFKCYNKSYFIYIRLTFSELT